MKIYKAHSTPFIAILSLSGYYVGASYQRGILNGQNHDILTSKRLIYLLKTNTWLAVFGKVVDPWQEIDNLVIR